MINVEIGISFILFACKAKNFSPRCPGMITTEGRDLLRKLIEQICSKKLIEQIVSSPIIVNRT
jgi:hypothetical protein